MKKMKLKHYRKKHGLTLEAMAEQVGVSEAAMSRYENGRVPAKEVMDRIIAVTNGAVQPNSFYDLAGTIK